jgi:hypothetical protein
MPSPVDKPSPVDDASAVRAETSSVEYMTWNVPGFSAERRLGRGATGEVWAGRDDATGEPVALKRLRPGGGEVDRDRLRSEAALLGAFQHPNVIGLRGVLGTDEGLVLILDLASGGSLAQLLARRERLRSGQVVALFGPLADALGAAHAVGLLHGRVSPGDVLFALDGRPLLADLGTAWLAGLGAGRLAGLDAGRLAGDDASPGYIDPAVRAGAAPGAASDVYSLAAVAAHALTGRALSESADGMQQWADHAQTLGVPLGLVLTLCAALDGDPARRPDAAVFARQLRATGPAESLAAVVPGLPVVADEVTAAAPGGAAALAGVDELTGLGALPGVDELPDVDAATGLGAVPGIDAVPDLDAVPGVDAVPGPDLPTGSEGLAGPGMLTGSRAVRDPGMLRGPGSLTDPGADSRAVTGSAVGPAPDALARRVPRPALAKSSGGGSESARRWSDGPRWWQDRGQWQAGSWRAPGSWRPGRFGRPPGTPPPARRPALALARSVGVAVGALALIAVAAFAWAATDTSPQPPARLAEEAPASAREWTRTLAALDTRRESAFALAEQRLLDEVYVPGSPPLAADQQAVQSLRASRATALGVRHDVRRVRVLTVEGERVRLELADRMPAYRIVDAAGATLRTVPARGEETFQVELARTPAGWRIATLSRED